jgi:hypothetical protein
VIFKIKTIENDALKQKLWIGIMGINNRIYIKIGIFQDK